MFAPFFWISPVFGFRLSRSSCFLVVFKFLLDYPVLSHLDMFFVRLYILPYSTLSIAHLDSTRLDLTLHHYLCSTVRTMLLAPSHHHKRKLFLEFSLLVLSSPAVYPHPAHALHIPKPNLIAPPRTYLCVVFSYLACVVFFFSTSATDRYNHTLPASSRRFPFHSLLHTCYLWHSVIFFFARTTSSII